MAQHHTQSKLFRDLSIVQVAGLSEKDAWKWLVNLRWGNMTHMPCPWCGVVDRHYPRRTRHQWRCKDCDRTFSVTTNTPFADRKLSFSKLVLCIYLYTTEEKGLAANKLCGQLDVTYRTAFQNLGKVREALHHTQDRTPLVGDVQIDGGHFCGKPRRARKRTAMTSAIANNRLRNRKASIVPKPSLEYWNIEKFKNRRIILVLRQLFPKGEGKGAQRTITFVIKAETAQHVLPLVNKYVDPSAKIQTDEGGAYAQLSAWFDHKAVCHSREYSTDDGVNNNQAESYFGRARRAEYGTYHGMRPQYLALYAAEFAWHEDTKPLSLKERFNDLMRQIFRCGHSEAFRRYAQGHRLGFEY